MVDFAGFFMPVSYSNIKDEHSAVRNAVGLFDVSHMGEFIVKGREALDWIQAVTTNDVAKLDIGDAQYSCLPNDQGGIVDDLLVYRLPEDRCSEGERAYMLVVNASNMAKDWDWIQSKGNYDAVMTDISSRTGLLALQGPLADKVLEQVTDTDLTQIAFYHHTKGVVAGIDNVIISATGYTGSGGYELYADASSIGDIWDALMAVGASHGITPCGLGARDTLRLEKGYCLYGNDINDETSPLEAGLGWITKLNKGVDFPSKARFIDQKANGVDRRLVGIIVDDRRVPRQGYKILSEAGEEVGVVTSGTQSPTLGISIGMGYVDVKYKAIDTPLIVDTGRKQLAARVTKVPFV